MASEATRKEKYDAYIASSEWQKLRKQALGRAELATSALREQRDREAA